MPDAPARSLVAFDLDCTLTVRDTFRPFVDRISGLGGTGRALLRRPLATVAAAGRGDRDRMKELVVAGAFTERKLEEVTLEADRFARVVCDGWLRPDTVGRLRWHQSRGDCVVIVTASLALYARTIGEILEVDGVIATMIEDDGAGTLTGRLQGPNCRGEAKVEGLRSWAMSRGLHGVPLTHAYGDSAGDAQLLAAAESPHRVDRHRWLEVRR